MTTPIYSDMNLTTEILDTDLETIQEDFPVYPLSVVRFNHTSTPYKNIYKPYSAIEAAFDGNTIDTDSPDWVKEVIAGAQSAGGSLLVRETHNSRFFYIDVTVTTAP